MSIFETKNTFKKQILALVLEWNQPYESRDDVVRKVRSTVYNWPLGYMRSSTIASGARNNPRTNFLTTWCADRPRPVDSVEIPRSARRGLRAENTLGEGRGLLAAGTRRTENNAPTVSYSSQPDPLTCLRAVRNEMKRTLSSDIAAWKNTVKVHIQLYSYIQC